jgi:hypothetical protein
MKAYRDSRGIAPVILNLDTRWRCVLNLPLGENLGTYYIGVWVDRGAGLDDLKKRKLSCSCLDSNPGPFSL